MKLAPLLHEFFDRYLPYIKGTSLHTIKSYRDAFKLFLPFAAKHHRIKVASLTVEHLSIKLILVFLDDLERDRNNIAKTRNQRLAALKSFAKMIRFMYPEKRELANRILNIPQKRTQKALVGFLYEEEVLKIFGAVDLKRKAKPGKKAASKVKGVSQLGQWPVQIMLVPAHAPYLKNADLLIAADCVAFAYADFHEDFLKGKVLLVGCPKLDDADFYKEKITQILKDSDIKSLTCVHMEVPCCFGLVKIVKEALKASGKDTPFEEVNISIKGERL